MTHDSTTPATETTPATIEPVTIRIDAGPVTPDFDGRSRGWQAVLILDPDDRDVTLHAGIGAGTPGNVWHNLALSLSINEAASGEALTEILESDEAQSLLAAICDSYEGTRWDGHNTVGVWAKEENEDGEFLAYTHEAHVARLEEMLSEAATFWSAGDWFAGAGSNCRADVRKAILASATEEAERLALAALVTGYVTDGAENDALLDEGDVAKYVARLAAEATDEYRADIFYVVQRDGTICTIDDADLDECVADAGNLGETWWVVEATSPVKAWRATRALRAEGTSAARAELRRLESAWESEALTALVAALPA